MSYVESIEFYFYFLFSSGILLQLVDYFCNCIQGELCLFVGFI